MKIIRTWRLKPCKCGGTPVIIVGYDTLQVQCECGKTGALFFGDYYDEGFMEQIYREHAIADWNKTELLS